MRAAAVDVQLVRVNIAGLAPKTAPPPGNISKLEQGEGGGGGGKARTDGGKDTLLGN